MHDARLRHGGTAVAGTAVRSHMPCHAQLRCYGTALLYKMGGRLQLSILGVVTYVLVVARTGTPTVPTALGVPYDYAPAVARVLGPTIAMSVTILKL